MKLIIALKNKYLSQENTFMLSVLLVNAGNYIYNLVLGRWLGPKQFSDAAILITLLLVLSFVAMTFQISVARFSATFQQKRLPVFLTYVLKNALYVGFFLGFITIAFAHQLQVFFKTSSSTMFVLFGCGIPLYFLMSVNRGIYQGTKQFNKLSITYQTEMCTRLLVTLGLIYVVKINLSNVVAVGIVISLLVALFPLQIKSSMVKTTTKLSTLEKQTIQKFFVITAFYELTQIVINNSDILLVKHYFDTYQAGLYASLALIGRVVYFIAWMFVMLLLPTVVQLKKEGKPTTPVFVKYVAYILCIAIAIVLMCKWCPVFIINTLFGSSYVSMAPLLWKYALATGIFAVANIFAYYFLSLDQYLPVIISGVFGVLQLVFIVFYHNTLADVVQVQIYAMLLLLLFQCATFWMMSRKQKTRV